MRVFKATYNDRRGKRQSAKKWTAEFRDHLGLPRRLTLFEDKSASEEAARKLQRLADLRRMNQPPGRDLAEFLESLPKPLQARLAEWDVLDRSKVAAAKPLSLHLADWKAELESGGNTAKHAQMMISRVEKLFERAGMTRWTQITGNVVIRALDGLQLERDLSAQSFNFYLQAVKSFAAWMVRERRATESPVQHLRGRNVRVDRRHDRRALAPHEVHALLKAAAAGPARYGVPGPDRALLYRIALETGLRSAELRSLHVSSFVLDGRPTVTVAAGYSKRRREDVLPLRTELAEALKTHFQDRLPSAKALHMPTSQSVPKMLRADLEAAGIPYRDDSGRVVDFHALRHTFITRLAESGVHPSTAQKLARHSTIALTLDRYTHTCIEDGRAALDKLPSLGSVSGEDTGATGTDGRGGR